MAIEGSGITPLMATDYDDIADDYVRAADLMPGNALFERPATMKLLPPLEGLDVLDAGCGAGFWTEHCVTAGARVVAFDPSARMAMHTAARVPEAKVVHGTIAEIEGEFDLILSCLVLHYVQDIERELRLLAGRMKAGGRLIVSTKHPATYLPVPFMQKSETCYFREFLVDPKWKAMNVHQWHRPLEKITRAIEGAGLVILKLREPRPLPALRESNPGLHYAGMHQPHFLHLVLWKPDKEM